MKLLSLTSTTPVSHSITLHGRETVYTAQFETAQFEDGAQITCFTYLGQGEGRPVLFATNGGPGSSCVWLHLGFFGPRRIVLEDPLRPPVVPPYRLEDNPHCLLDICDLVLADPPGCGFSRLPEGEGEYFSVDGDAKAFALFMERWLELHHRANVPLYFAGESYGTVRGAALADALMGGPFSAMGRLTGVSLAGELFLGTAFTTAATILDQPPVEECVRALLGCAAVVSYHYPERFWSLEQAIDEAWSLAPVYVGTLFQGRTLPEEDRRQTAKALERFTNIPTETLLAQDLRFTVEQFRNAVVPGKQAGGYDGRYLLDGPGNPGSVPLPGMRDPVAEDPAMAQYTPSFVGGMALLREELALPEGVYTAINFQVNGHFDYKSSRSPLASLENAMRRNQAMELFFGVGLYDLVCLPGNVRYIMYNSNLPLDRVTAVQYTSGHMPYLGEETAEALERDIRAFLQGGRERI